MRRALKRGATLTMAFRTIDSVAPRFSARRMVKDYVETMYAPAIQSREKVGR